MNLLALLGDNVCISLLQDREVVNNESRMYTINHDDVKFRRLYASCNHFRDIYVKMYEVQKVGQDQYCNFRNYALR